MVAFFVVHTSNNERGFPLAGLILLILVVFWSYVAERTVFGRHVYAVGGSAEAARRAGACTLADLAEALTNRGVPTPVGRSTRRPEQVRSVLR